jgi:GntR family histidine utilization transcriptional repressor
MSGNRVPRYQALKELIIAKIASGELKPGDRVPSENALVEAEGVSRMTANRALRELTDAGYVERVHGSGTFVAELQAASHPLEVRNIADEVAFRGHRWSAEVLVQEETTADDWVASALDIPRGETVYHTRVIHAEDGTPIQLEDRYVRADFAPDFLAQDFTQQTPSAYLSAITPLQTAEHIVRAEMPAPAVRKALRMHDSEPLLVVIRRTWVDDRPVTCGRFHHPGARFELSGRFAPGDSGIKR